MANPHSKVRIQCIVRNHGDEIVFNWIRADQHGILREPISYRLKQNALDAIIKANDSLRKSLRIVTDVKSLSLALAVPDSAEELICREELSRECYELAKRGWEAYECLFTPGLNDTRSVANADEARELLVNAGNTNDSIVLEILQDTQAILPWGVLYNREPIRPGMFQFGDSFCLEDWLPFWGVQYSLGVAFTQNVIDTSCLHPPSQLGEVDELVVYCPGFLPEGVHFDRGINTIGDLRTRLSATGIPELLYWYSHTKHTYRKDSIKLKIQSDTINSHELWSLLRKSKPRPALAFAVMNGCGTAETPNTSDRGFIGALSEAGISGAILTESSVVNIYAYHIGEQIRKDLKQGTIAAKVLQDIRRNHKHLPTALAYTAACRPELSLRPGASNESDYALSKRGALISKKPYRALACLDYDDQMIFKGRDTDVRRCAKKLAKPALRILLLHGASGVGKSSFLRAGLVPYLVNAKVGYAFINENTVYSVKPQTDINLLSVRPRIYLPGTDLAATLTEILREMEELCLNIIDEQDSSRPNSVKSETGDNLRTELIADPSKFGVRLAVAAKRLFIRPVIVIDQFEQVYTLAPNRSVSKEHEEDLSKAFEMLHCAAQVTEDDASFKIILSLRTEYLGQIQHALVDDLPEPDAVDDCYLGHLDCNALAEAIKAPTDFVYNIPGSETQQSFCFADRLHVKIAETVLDHCQGLTDSPLPIAQVVCAQLYDELSSTNREINIEADALRNVVVAGLSTYVQKLLLLSTSSKERMAVRELLIALHRKNSDGIITSSVMYLDEALRRWAACMYESRNIEKYREEFDSFLNTWIDEHHLFSRLVHKKGNGELLHQICLSHDALAIVANEWEIERDKERQDAELLKERNAAAFMKRLLIGAIAATVLFIGATILSAYMYLFAKEETVRANGQTHIAKQAAVAERDARSKALMALRILTDEMVENQIARGISSIEENKAFFRAIINQYEGFAAITAIDSESRSIRAEGLARVGLMRRHLGEQQDAESNFRESLEIRTRLAVEYPSNPDFRQASASMHNNLGVLLRDTHRYEEAKQSFESAIAIWTLLNRDFPSNIEARESLGTCHSNMGSLLHDIGQYPAAEKAHDEALKIRNELTKEHPSHFNYRRAIAISKYNLGNVYRNTSQHSSAKEAFEFAIKIQQILVKEFPGHLSLLQELARSLHNLGILQLENNKFQEAKQSLDDALKIRADLARDYPRSGEFRQHLANSYSSEGDYFRTTSSPKEIKEAIQAYSTAIDIQRKMVKEFNDRPDYSYELARSYINYGYLFSTSKRFMESECSYNSAQVILDKLVEKYGIRPDIRQALATCRNNQGLDLHAQNQHKKSKEAFDYAIMTRKQLTKEFPTRLDFRKELASSYNNLALLYVDIHNLKDAKLPFSLMDAELAYFEALKLKRKLVEEFPNYEILRRDLVETLINHVHLCNMRGDQKALRDSIAESERHLGVLLKSNPNNPIYRQMYLGTLQTLTYAHAGLLENVEAIRTAEKIRDLGWKPSTDAYNATITLCECTSIASRNSKLDSKKRKEAVRFYGDEAMNLLRNAINIGFNDIARLKKDSDLDILRVREDFQKILVELEKRLKP